MFRYLSVIMILSLLLGGAACSRNKKEAPVLIEPKPNEASAAENTQAKDVSQNNQFAFEIYQELAGKGKNLFLSPYSINTAMAMAYTGARSNTAAEIAKVMGYDAKPDQVHESFYQSLEMLNAIRSRKRAEFNIANAMFNAEANKERTVPEYQEVLQKFFASDLYSLDFAKAGETADFINQWVEKKTNSRIKDIVSERQIADSNDGLVLVNTIYFKANWLQQFDEKNTVMERFYTSSSRDEKSAKVMPMMHQTESFPYAQLPECQLLEMPYADPEIAMLLAIPKDIKELSANMNPDMWQSWMQALSKPRKVEVIIPKFRLEESLDKLVDTFKALGISDAFSGGKADFSGILKPDGGQNIYISDIVHKSFIEVLEKGTEAAAATQIGFAKTSIGAPVTDVPVFRADQPFFCAIVHKPSGELLFMGNVVDPESAE
jgi:serpin B